MASAAASAIEAGHEAKKVLAVRVTAEILFRALTESERNLLPERKTILMGTTESEVRIRGVVDFERWADAVNAICFPPMRVVERKEG